MNILTWLRRAVLVILLAGSVGGIFSGCAIARDPVISNAKPAEERSELWEGERP